MLSECLRTQSSSAEVARDRGTDSLARNTPIRRDTGVKTGDPFDALRVASDLSGTCGNLGAEGFRFANRGAGLHDGAISSRSRNPLPERTVARDIDRHLGARW